MTKTMQDAMGNLPLLERTIAESPFDAVVAVSPESVRYTGDVNISTQTSIRDRLALIVWPKGKAPIFILCQVEEGYVRRHSWIQDIRSFREFFVAPIDLLADVLTELGLAAGKVAIETEYLAAAYMNRLMTRLPQLQVEPAEPVFARARMFKSEREKAALIGGFRSTEKAMLATYTTVHEGESEKSMADRLAAAIMHLGADAVAFNHINAGPNTGFPHMAPSDYRIRKGDILKADSGGFYSEYYSNVGRTAKFGALTDEDRDYWSKLRDIHHRIIDMLRPGNTGRQLFAEAARLHEAVGLPFPYAHNGHGIGLSVHERPMISPHEDRPYEAGMISTVETRFRQVGKVGYHMEDLVEVTAGAPVVHSTFFDNEAILVV